MTISYSPDSFFHILFCRWDGSILKTCWKLMVAYLCLYYTFYFTYHYALDDNVIATQNSSNVLIGKNAWKTRILLNETTGLNQTLPHEPITSKLIWRWIVLYVRQIEHYYDLSFLLGFFVMLIVDRWWAQAVIVIRHCSPEAAVRHIASFVGISEGEKSRMIRRSLSRWIVATQALSWRTVSTRLLKRLPTEEHMVDIGLLTRKEKDLMDGTSASGYARYMIPLLWCFNLLGDLHKRGIIDTWQHTNAVELLDDYFEAHKKLWVYSWLSVPLAYTHVAFLATHAFFLVTVLGRQPVLEGDTDTIFPFFMVLQFIFYMGWLHVAQDLIDPYGEDDDDYEMNYLMDRNIHYALYLADSVESEVTEIVPLEDPSWDEKYSYFIPHTRSSRNITENIPKGNSEVRHFEPTEKDLETVLEKVEQVREEIAAPALSFQGLIRSIANEGTKQ